MSTKRSSEERDDLKRHNQALLRELENKTRELERVNRTVSRDIAERAKAEEALRESESRFQTLADVSPVGIFRTDAEGQTTYTNPRWSEIAGLKAQDALGRGWLRAVHPDDREQLARAWEAARLAQRTSQADYRLVRPDGTISWVMGQAAPEKSGTGRVLGYVGTITDVTDRRRVEEALVASTLQFRAIFDQAAVGMVLAEGAAGSFVRVNRHFCRMVGYSAEELLQMTSRQITVPDDISTDAKQVARIRDGVVPEATWEKRYRRKDGTIVWVTVFVAPLDPAEPGTTQRVGVINDITERKQAEVDLRESLREKEALLREVHHRVKNNLQVVTSLLRLETGRSQEPVVRIVLKDMQSRIQAMALLHETLYRSGNFAQVDLGMYLKQLTTQTFRALNARPGAIELDIDLASIQVGVDQAIPCGLLLNELISNCLKHGFPGNRAGRIRVELPALDGSSQTCLRVSDNGVGLPADFESKRGRSLGLQLVSDLARQLQGRLEIGAGPGAAFSVTFLGRNATTASGNIPRS